MNDPVETVLAALTRAGCSPNQVKPDQWESRCPAHKGSRSNLAISRGHDGRCLLHCHHADASGQGCRHDEILAAINLTPRDLFAEGTSTLGGQPAASRTAVKSPQKKAHASIKEAAFAIARALNKPRGGQTVGMTWRAIGGWGYRNAAGVETFAVIRFEGFDATGAKIDKTYRPVHHDGRGWVVGDPPGKLPLLDLPEVIAAPRVFVVEGEKCAELAHGIGLVATTPAHGAKSPRKTDWSPLAGKDVIILPDADEPGEGFAKLVVDLLGALVPPPTIRVVRLPGLESGDDIEQWLAAKPQDPVENPTWRDDARAELLALVEAAAVEKVRDVVADKPDGLQRPNEVEPTGPRWAPGLTVRALDQNNYGKVVQDFGDKVSVHFISPDGHEATPTLPKAILEPTQTVAMTPTFAGEPEPLADKLLPVPTLPPELIPEALRPWLVDIAERIGCSVEFAVTGAMVALATLVGRKVGIRPKRYDDWLVVANLWGGIVGRPGVMKTPALSATLKPLRRLANEAEERDQAERSRFEGSALLRKVRAEVAKEELKKAVKPTSGKTSTDIEELARQAADAGAEAPPPRKRYIVNDATVEMLGELLRDNPTGLMVFRDELTGWFHSFDKPGHETDRPFYLETWNGGMTSHTVDRIGRGTIVIPSPCISMLGGIQPGPLRAHLKATSLGGEADDGLLSRFQMLVYPDMPGPWINVDRWPDSPARDRAEAVFRYLDQLDPTRIGATNDFDDEVPYLRLSDPAQDFFDGWRTDLENEKLKVEGESPMVESHLSKYRSLMPKLALLIHLVEVADGATHTTVSLEAAEIAAAWCDFLEAHARRIYTMLEDTAQDSARALAAKIKAGEVPTPFSSRSIYRKGWSNLATSGDVDRAVAVLEGVNWLASVETTDTGGAPRTDIHIHPCLVKEEVAG